MLAQTPPLSTDTLPDLLCTKQAVARLLHMSERSVERLVRSRRFPGPVRLGKQTYWRRDVVHNWLEQKFQSQAAWKPKGK